MTDDADERRLLLSRIEKLEKRIQLADDIEAIREVTARYCRAADKNGPTSPDFVDRIADCFTTDGVWDGGELGRYEGMEGFRKLWEGAGSLDSALAIHRTSNPIIKVDGDRAFGQWHVLALSTIAGEALWTAGRYENEYRRTSEGWKIQIMKYIPWLWTRHSEGWAKEPFWRIEAAT